VTTKIYKSYSEFQKREDEKINGVSEEFAKLNPDFIADNETNIGCWQCMSCKNCEHCFFCYSCENCQFCVMCEGCLECEECLEICAISNAKNINIHGLNHMILGVEKNGGLRVIYYTKENLDNLERLRA
jgi:hypothetical protein